MVIGTNSEEKVEASSVYFSKYHFQYSKRPFCIHSEMLFHWKLFEFGAVVDDGLKSWYLHGFEESFCSSWESIYVDHQGMKVAILYFIQQVWHTPLYNWMVKLPVSFLPQRCSAMRGAKILISLLQSSLMVSFLAVFHVSSPESFGMFIGSVQMDDNSFFSNERWVLYAGNVSYVDIPSAEPLPV